MTALTVCCVKAKPAYDHVWVNRLAKAVRANLTIPHRFICYTDDSSGIACTTRPLPRGIKGWWAKLALFRPFLIAGPVLYLDLDTLILGNLDFVIEYKGPFAILRDFYRPEGYGSGVMLWNEPQPHVWQKWLESGMPDHALGDQGWMEAMIPNADRLQDVFPGKFVSYKVHCEDGMPPADPRAAVLSFHGLPKQTDFPESHWVSRMWRGEERVAA